MFHSFVFCCLCFWRLVVFADADAVKTESVTVMEGDSVSLNSSIAKIQTRDIITWTFGPQMTKIAVINEEENDINTFDVPDGRFKGRLTLEENGSLTIMNIRTDHAGVYQIAIIGPSKLPTKNFNVTVYARLPVPVIRNSHCSSSPPSNCSLVCSSVVNVSHATLSWYKGISVLSSISASNLSIILSLPLEEYQDKNTYSCVLNNPISNQTTHLNLTQHCYNCSDLLTPLISAAAAGFLLLITAIVIFYLCKKHRKPDQQVQARNEDITYADPTFYKRKEQKSEVKVEEEVVYAGVVIKH